MEILVTGGGGFLGSHIVRKLLGLGHTVRIFGRNRYPQLQALGSRVSFYQGSLTQANNIDHAVKGVSAVFHVASKTGIWGCWKEYYDTNVVGTSNVVTACLTHGVKDLIYTSTPSVVFEKEDIILGDESLPYAKKFLCHYAHTKKIAEAYVLQSNDEQRLRTVALRPHLLWGPGDPHLLPRIIEKARHKKLIQIGKGNNKVDITHVENAADAHILAWQALQEGKAAGKAYFISQGEPVNLWEWIKSLLQQLDLPPIKQTISFPKAYALGAALEGVFKVLPHNYEPPMTRFVACQLAKSHYFDISAARKDLKYTPNIPIKLH